MVQHHVALIADTAKIKDDELRRVEKVLRTRMRRDVAPIWDIQTTIQSYRDVKKIADAWPILVRDDIQQPGAASYHSDKNGKPFAMIAYTPDWPFMVSHDLLEMLIDPLANRFVGGPNPRPGGKGKVNFLVEVCDPCADPANGYQLDGLKMADFCTPDYYSAKSAKGRYSFTGAISKPFEVLQGGYLTWMDPANRVAKGILRGETRISRLGSLRRQPKSGGRTRGAAPSRERDDESLAADARSERRLPHPSAAYHGTADRRIWNARQIDPMAWTELYPRSLDDLHRVLNRISDARDYVFRGQASAAWKNLKPSLHRVLGDDKSTGEQIGLETAAIREFRRHGRSLLQVSELDYFKLILGSVTLMQHYGAPTRLLDWTLSPWVACYFAVREDHDDDAAIWAFNRSELDRANHARGLARLRDFISFRELLSAATVDDWAWYAESSGPYIDMFRYEYANAQMGAQQSLFTVCGKLLHHEEALKRSLPEPWQTVRVIVPKVHKRELRHQLFRMNVGALNLFPSVDGVGRHISEALLSGFPLGDEGLFWNLEARARRRKRAPGER